MDFYFQFLNELLFRLTHFFYSFTQLVSILLSEWFLLSIVYLLCSKKYGIFFQYFLNLNFKKSNMYAATSQKLSPHCAQRKMTTQTTSQGKGGLMKLLKKEMKVVSRNSLVQLSITLLFYVYAKKHFGKVVVSGYPN